MTFSRHGVHEGQHFILRRLWAEDGLTPGDRRLVRLVLAERGRSLEGVITAETIPAVPEGNS